MRLQGGGEVPGSIDLAAPYDRRIIMTPGMSARPLQGAETLALPSKPICPLAAEYVNPGSTISWVNFESSARADGA